MKYWAITVSVIVLIVIVEIVLRQRSHTPSPTIQQGKSVLKGYSFSPKSFQVNDITTLMTEAKQDGSVISWAGNWHELQNSNNAAINTIAQAKKYDLTPVVIVGPSDGEVFDGIFQQGFKEAVISFVKNNSVPYLGLGNEVDQMLLESRPRYEAFISSASSLAKEVRAASAQTKVFTTFQLESSRGLRGGLFGGKSDPAASVLSEITNLADFDMIGFTTYPCLIYQSPSDIPEDYYSSLSQYVGTKPVIFTEVGWFRESSVKGWESSQTEQADFINRFKTLTGSLKPRIIIWPFLYDPKINNAAFKNIGLLGETMSDSLGLQAWKSFSY